MHELTEWIRDTGRIWWAVVAGGAVLAVALWRWLHGVIVVRQIKDGDAEVMAAVRTVDARAESEARTCRQGNEVRFGAVEGGLQSIRADLHAVRTVTGEHSVTLGEIKVAVDFLRAQAERDSGSRTR